MKMPQVTSLKSQAAQSGTRRSRVMPSVPAFHVLRSLGGGGSVFSVFSVFSVSVRGAGLCLSVLPFRIMPELAKAVHAALPALHVPKARFMALCAASCTAGALLLSGCATEEIAKGLATKNTSGNGTVVDTHVGINADNKIPEIRTLFISGDFATVKAGTNAVSYREESSASVWNASSVTKKRFLSITLTDPGDVPAAIKAVAEVFKEAEKETDAQKDVSLE